jgi:peroxiredoxin
VIAISPSVPEKSAEIKDRHGLEFPILSDAGNTWARSLGLIFALPEDLREVYRGFGIVLPDHNGDDSWELPLSARIVIDTNGVIRGIDANPDYTHRPEPEATLEVLRALA